MNKQLLDFFEKLKVEKPKLSPIWDAMLSTPENTTFITIDQLFQKIKGVDPLQIVEALRIILDSKLIESKYTVENCITGKILEPFYSDPNDIPQEYVNCIKEDWEIIPVLVFN